MDMQYIIDGILHKYIHENNLWDKLDSDKPLPKKVIKNVIDVVSKCQYSSNMICEANICQRIVDIRKYRKQLKHLQSLPVIEQRTEEWYAMRKNMITASDFGEALGADKFGKKTDPNKIYEKKCGYEPPQVYDYSSVFLKWGVMFEPVATMLYEHRNGIKIHEFGLIQHPDYSYLGASPDGISDMGIMLEIKCPYKRVITDDSILKQYYYQIQGQLDACKLQECDFLEVRFDKYQTIEDFKEDYEETYHIYTHDYKEKGIIIEVEENKYIYSPYNTKKEIVLKWYEEHCSNVVNIVFWYMHSFAIKRVHKDNNFVSNMNIDLGYVWENIQKYTKNHSLYLKEVKTKTKKISKESTKGLVKTGSLFV